MFRSLNGRLRNGGVADMADLAVAFIGRIGMPVADCMRRERDHSDQECDGQETLVYSSRHIEPATTRTPILIPLFIHNNRLS